VSVVAPPRVRGPLLGGGTPIRRGIGALAIGRGRGVAATMHTERTAATERMGESPADWLSARAQATVTPR